MSFYQDFNDKTAMEAWHAQERAPYRHFELKPQAPTLGAGAGRGRQATGVACGKH
jgi:taurine dioxygenase